MDDVVNAVSHHDGHPGLALFYGGLVRTKNMLSVLMQVMVVFSLIAVLWAAYGYSLAFGGEGLFIADLSKAFLIRRNTGLTGGHLHLIT